ncbi:MAG: aldo/keto reductase [Candidatus Latescibacteria bacterium]|nr:aldo/keto reductase [Candidatus Latescibacterota bacterium]
MQYRTLGNTGLKVSALGFGCGAVGGLLVRGEYPAMRRAVERAIELGVTYFDTAAMYGSGQSEANLGAILRELSAPVLVGTKVNLAPAELDAAGRAVRRHTEASLRRLGRDCVDVLYCHNFVGPRRQGGWAAAADLEPVLRTLEALQREGKTRAIGFNGLGDSQAVHQVLGLGGFDALQTCYNLLNPTAGQAASAGYPFQDFGQLIDRAAAQGTGVVAIRVLAGGALSGSEERHPVGTAQVGTISTAADYAADVASARRFSFLVQEGHAESLAEAALRFALGKAGISSVLVGVSSLEQLEAAAQAEAKGPLPAAAVARFDQVWQGLAV